MGRKVARQDEPTGAEEDQAISGEMPVEDKSPSFAQTRLEGEVPAVPVREGEAPAEPVREYKPMAELEEHPLDTEDAVRRFSAGTSAKFAFRAACYLAGRAADKLVSVYARAVTLDHDYLADFNKSAGLAHARHKRWDKAIPLLEKSLALAPDDVPTRLRLAEAYAAENQHERACQHLERILATDPSSAVAVRALGAICARQQNYDRAIEYLEKAVKLDPDHAQTYFRLGLAYDNKKRYEQAAEAFRKAIRLDPRFAKAYQAMGFTYESMGNRALAVECFKKALELE